MLKREFAAIAAALRRLDEGKDGRCDVCVKRSFGAATADRPRWGGAARGGAG